MRKLSEWQSSLYSKGGERLAHGQYKAHKIIWSGSAKALGVR